MAKFKFKKGDIVYSRRGYMYEILDAYMERVWNGHGKKWCAYRVFNLSTKANYIVPAKTAHKRYIKTKGKAAKILFGKT